ncbi:hypothetical protein ACN4EK_14700 [Pantanalinema rosaneae CENA516]|uniref:hypothetical protein n=1 Tax=Pantanalinema rosaneae TaxID=1620701 RepID=UPI003D6F3B45
MTLVVGLLIAFALQLLLANLGIATGITLLSAASSDRANQDDDPNKTESGRPIGLVLGGATLLSVNLALFVACFLAVKLSMATSAWLGAVLGVVIWSAYLLLLGWLGVSAIGFLLGSVGEVIGLGWQGLKTMTQFVVGRQPDAIEERLQQQITAELAMIRETQQALNAANLESLQTLLQPALAAGQVAQPAPSNLDTDILNFLKSAQANELTLEELDRRLQRLEQPQNPEPSKSWAIDVKPLLQAVRSRIDLSDLDVQRVIDYLRVFPDQIGETWEKISAFVLPTSTIQDDVEEFLLNADLTQLSRKTIKSEFRAVIYDVDANPHLIHQQLSQLTSDQLTTILEQRQDLSARKIAKIVDRLEAVRQEVLAAVTHTIAQARFQQMNQPILDYLRTTTITALKPKLIYKQFRRSLEQSGTTIREWTPQLQSLDRDCLRQPLLEREDLDQAIVASLLDQLETSRDRLISEIQDLQIQVQAQAETLWQDWSDYFKHSSEKLNTRNIKRQLKTSLKTAKVDPNLLKPYLPDYDREAMQQWLSDRGDLTEQQIHRVCDRAEKVWQSIFEPAESSSQWSIANLTEQVTQALTHYLQQTLQQSELAALDVNAIQQDFLKVLQSLSVPAGVSSLITLVDWQQVIHHLIQQHSLPATSVTALIRPLQQAVYTISKPPRRWAVRAAATLPETAVDTVRQLGTELPEAVMQPVIQKFDQTRSQLIQQVEQLQQQAQQRVEALKLQARQQMAVARKTAVTATWWLFGTAVTSLITSAIAGFLAVTQFIPMLVH